MLNKMLPDVARQTADIDFSIQSSDIYADLIKTMDKLGQYFISKGYIARHEIKPEIHQHLFLPTAERALCEGIQLREFIDEGLLVESLQSYLYSHDWNATDLREMSIRYHIHDLDYWVQEAREWETA